LGQKCPLAYYPFLLSTLVKTRKNWQNALNLLTIATGHQRQQRIDLSIALLIFQGLVGY
jgi:hypothetical protein